MVCGYKHWLGKTELLRKMQFVVVLFSSIFAATYVVSLPTPKPLTVDCLSMGNGEDFKQRLKLRDNAEDQTTIWLFKGEVLNINFDLTDDAVVDVLDVRYSNDGDWDDISLSLDGEPLGSFKTEMQYAWGDLWNNFQSSGPVGGRRELKAGQHVLSLIVDDADQYGVEIDYIRFEVHGGKIEHLSKDKFHCIHKPSSSVS